jgi:hypothetical protein
MKTTTTIGITGHKDIVVTEQPKMDTKIALMPKH